MSENLTGVVEHPKDDLDLHAHFLQRAEHFARYRRLAWLTALFGLLAQALGMMLILGAMPIPPTPGVPPDASPLVVLAAGALNLAATALFVACVSLYALSRERSALWGVMAFFCSCAIPLVILLVIEDFGFGPARARLEQQGAPGVPASRPSGAVIGALVAGILLFSGFGAVRLFKAFNANLARFQEQAQKNRPGLPGLGATAEATPEQDVDAGPMPEIARRPCQVGSTPAGAAILLDGESTGKTTPAKITIWAGKDHRVGVSLEGYAPAEQEVFVGLKDRPELAFTLVAYPKVEVASQPEGAEVLVGGQVKLSATPGWFYVEGDAVTLTVRKRGFVDVRRKIVLGKDQPAAVSVRLVPAGYVTVESQPEGAEVLIDGARTGQRTPAEVAVAAGKKHDLQLELDGATTPKTRLKPLKAGKSAKVKVDIAAARKAAMRARIKKISGELAQWSAALRRLEARETGFAESAAVERRRAAELERTQQKVDELVAELDTAREDLLALEQ